VKHAPPIEAWAFDLGDTLVEYEGVPLSWVDHYDEALVQFAVHLGVAPTPSGLAAGRAVLRRYNTRLNPRPDEVPFAIIAGELAASFGRFAPIDEVASARAFFRIFRQRLRAFADTRPALSRLRADGRPIGVLTDVPYGMPRELVLDDLRQAELDDLVDVLLTSREAGSRKPAPAALGALAAALAMPPARLAYVGNERKDIDAARAAGCVAILLDRAGDSPAWGQHATIRSLTELACLIS
jgi:putative hydrolase of the HAD superfamily